MSETLFETADAPAAADLAAFACCARSNIVVMDFALSDGPRVNRACIACFAHWYGRPGRVRKYRRREWDAMLAHELRAPNDIARLAAAFVVAFEGSPGGSGGAYDALRRELELRGMIDSPDAAKGGA